MHETVAAFKLIMICSVCMHAPRPDLIKLGPSAQFFFGPSRSQNNLHKGREHVDNKKKIFICSKVSNIYLKIYKISKSNEI
jgi:hypothetical protein